MVRLAFVGLLLVSACVQDDLTGDAPAPTLDEHFFRCDVQPVIAATCAFMACHGNDVRPLSLYAEQRFRLGISWDDFEMPLTDAELSANFIRVAGFVGGPDGQPALLSEKPLDTRAGGLYHGAKGLYGSDDVFLSSSEPGYQALRDFVVGTSRDPSCTPREDIRQ